MDPDTILRQLQENSHPENLEGMARYGIETGHALGIPMPWLRDLAARLRAASSRGDPRLHELAGELWDSGVHEARILASLIDPPGLVSPEQMETWAAAFDSWDVCDQVCSNLFAQTPFARQKALAWSARPETFVKRAGFVLMAQLATRKFKLDEEILAGFLPAVEREAGDGRNFVRKAANWALRQIGKRSLALNGCAVSTARRILAQGTPSARWIASDALRELTSPEVQGRFSSRERG